MYKREEYKISFENAIKNSKSIEEAHKKYFPEMNIKTFKKILKELDMYHPNQGKKGISIENYPELYEKMKNKFISKLVENSSMQSNKLRIDLFKYNIKEKRCEICRKFFMEF